MIGTTLSHYKIEAELGRGGMGIVYRARDTKLNREVALKILPSSALATEEDRARFYREAQAAAQLHHAHIATIFEIDEAIQVGEDGKEINPSDGPRPFIAMELIEGETLDSRIKKGLLKLNDAIRIASEIADALGAAHAKDIVHRDIKSANVMLTGKNEAKVLDFGLAKTAQSTQLTRMGSTMGTVAYMSPEQARGEEVDRRTDLWALGVVLYEMITGINPFGGDYEQAVVYSILNVDPEPLTAVRTGVPMDLEWIVSKCLAKNKDERYQSATDLQVDLKRTSASIANQSSTTKSTSTRAAAPIQGANASPSSPSSASPIRTILSLAGVAVLAFALSYLLFGRGSGTTESDPTRKIELVLPGIETARFPSISPDKKWIGFIGRDTLKRNGLFLFEIETGEIHYTEDTQAANEHPRFSPDGSRVAFAVFGDRTGIYVSAIPGGVPQRVTDFGRVPVWFDDRTLAVLAEDRDGRPRIVHLPSGDTTRISLSGETVLNTNGIYWTSRLPGTRTIIADLEPVGRSGLAGTLAFIDTESEQLILSEPGIINPYLTPDGFLIFQRGTDESALLARRFDVASFRFTGPPRELLPRMAWPAFSVGTEGSLIYAPEIVRSRTTRPGLYTVNADNGASDYHPLNSPPNTTVRYPRISSKNSDRALVTVEANDNNMSYIASLDIKTGNLTQRTFDGNRSRATWSADETSMYYEDPTLREIYRLSLTAGGPEKLVLDHAINPAASPDGKWLAMAIEKTEDDLDLYLMDLSTRELIPVDTSDGWQYQPNFSPDSRHLVYMSRTDHDRSGVTWVADVDGPGRYQAWKPYAFQRQAYLWSSDGAYIYLIDSREIISRIRVSTVSGFSVLSGAEDIASIGLGTTFGIDPGSSDLAIISSSVDPVKKKIQNKKTTLVWWENWTKTLK